MKHMINLRIILPHFNFWKKMYFRTVTQNHMILKIKFTTDLHKSLIHIHISYSEGEIRYSILVVT